MDRYISVEMAIKHLLEKAAAKFPASFYLGLFAAVDELKKLPAADVRPVVRGEWEWFEEWSQSTTEHPAECEDCGWRCGRCKNTLENMVGGYWDDLQKKPKLKFCPNCGGDMRGGRTNGC